MVDLSRRTLAHPPVAFSVRTNRKLQIYQLHPLFGVGPGFNYRIRVRVKLVLGAGLWLELRLGRFRVRGEMRFRYSSAGDWSLYF